VNVKNDMAIMQDESFGPVIGIMKVQDDDEA
jgi:acyl-CoA reductase-like NAD-dependent aldehyde dehydrogenase